MSAAGAGARPGPSRLSAVPWWAWIILLVALEGLAVLLLLPTSWSVATTGDGAEYQRYAFNLIHHGVFSESPVAPYHPGVVRSPGYPSFLAVLEWIGGRHAEVVQAVQFGLLAATSILVGLIGREVAGPRVGNLAAVMCAVYLPLIGLATYFLTETVATFLLTTVVLLLLRARRRPRVRSYLAIGAVLCVLAYVRPELALVAVPIVLILLLNRRSALSLASRSLAAAALAAVLVVPLVPWLIRDASVTGGHFIPMQADGGVALLASADQYDGVMSESFDDVAIWNAQVGRLTGVPDAATEGIQAPVKFADARHQVKVNDIEQSAAVKAFKALSAGTVIAHLPGRLVGLWRVGDETPPEGGGSLWHHAAQLEFVVLLVLTAIGVVIRRRHLLEDWPLWLVAAVLTVTHLVFPVESRYTVPARPMLMIYASVGALALARAGSAARGRPQRGRRPAQLAD